MLVLPEDNKNSMDFCTFSSRKLLPVRFGLLLRFTSFQLIFLSKKLLIYNLLQFNFLKEPCNAVHECSSETYGR